MGDLRFGRSASRITVPCPEAIEMIQSETPGEAALSIFLEQQVSYEIDGRSFENVDSYLFMMGDSIDRTQCYFTERLILSDGERILADLFDFGMAYFCHLNASSSR